MKAKDMTEITEAVEALTALVDEPAAHWSISGEPGDECVDVQVADLRALLSELTRLQEEVKGLAGFAKVSLDCLWDGHDMDGADIQDAALKHGLLVETKYDPAIHNDSASVDAQPGDQWFVPAPWLVALQGQQS